VEIDDEVQSRLKKLARSVKMHGFRPGKVPLRVVAQQYEGQVRREVLGDALQKALATRSASRTSRSRIPALRAQDCGRGCGAGRIQRDFRDLP